jgi:WD40 repeat protein
MFTRLLTSLRTACQLLALSAVGATLATWTSLGRAQQSLTKDGADGGRFKGLKEERAVFEGIPGLVMTVCFSPDGKLLAAIGSDMVKVWDVATRKEAATLKDIRTGRIAFSPDGKLLATTGSKGPSRLYDTATWKLRAELPGNLEGTCGIAFSPDGKILAFSEPGGLVRLWDPATGKEMGVTIALSVPHLDCLAFSPDGKMLAGVGFKKGAVYDLVGKKVRFTLPDHVGRIHTVAFSPDGKSLLTAVYHLERQIFLWDAATGKRRLQFDVRTLPNLTYGAAFSPDGKTVALVGFGPFVHLFDAATGRQWAERESDDYYWCVAFSPDGRTLATGCNGGAVKLWDVPKKK